MHGSNGSIIKHQAQSRLCEGFPAFFNSIFSENSVLNQYVDHSNAII